MKYGIRAIPETDVRDYDNFRTSDNCFPSLCRIDEVHFSANPRATAGFFRGEFRNVRNSFYIFLSTRQSISTYTQSCRPWLNHLKLSGLYRFAMDLQKHKSLEQEEMSSSLFHNNADPTTDTWQEIFKSSESQHSGFVESIEEAMVLLRKYELETTTKFSCYKSDKMFGSGGETCLCQRSRN